MGTRRKDRGRPIKILGESPRGRMTRVPGARLEVLGLYVALSTALGGSAWADGMADLGKCATTPDLDLRTQYCSRAIQSSQLSGTNLATAFIIRGDAYEAKEDYDRAIQDYDQALRLNPTSAAAFLGRATAYDRKGDPDRAIQDYNQVLRLVPTDAEALRARGILRFVLGQYAAAQPDLAEAAALNPTDAYAPLWRYLARARAGQEGRADLAASAQRLDLATWPGPVVALYLGNTTPEALLAAARNSDPQTQREQQCEAYFFLREQALLRGDHAEALRLFRATLDTGVTRFFQYDAARAELRRLSP